MLYSNIGANKQVLEQALRAVALYRDAGDARGLACALSQVAARYAPQGRTDDARAAAQEALRLAEETGDRRLLADTLRRCAQAFGSEGDDAVRARYEQSVALFRALGRDDETARALEWWSQWEAEGAGDFRAAAELMLEASRLDERDVVKMFTMNDVAGYFLATGDLARAEPPAREALAAAAKAHHRVLTALSIAVHRGHRGAARAGSRRSIDRLRRASVARRGVADRPVRAESRRSAPRAAGRTVEKSELVRLLAAGAALSEEQAVGRSDRVT